jgi:hypothetical protein
MKTPNMRIGGRRISLFYCLILKRRIRHSEGLVDMVRIVNNRNKAAFLVL